MRLKAFYEVQRLTLNLFRAEFGYSLISMFFLLRFFKLLELIIKFSPSLGMFFNDYRSAYCFFVEIVVMPSAIRISFEFEELYAYGKTSLSRY